MLTVDLADAFLRNVKGQALREGHRDAGALEWIEDASMAEPEEITWSSG